MLKTLRTRRMASGFAVGLGSCVALSGGFYNRTGRTVKTSDQEMIRQDWQNVGSELRAASYRVMTKACR